MSSFSPPRLPGLALAGAASAALFFFSPACAEALPRLQIVGHFARADVVESSGIAASRRQPGVYWTLNDSGGEPEVYAFDLNGRDLGAWRLPGVINLDWEALSLGPCGDPQAGDCLYIGDTGDNAERRQSSILYRVSEPTVTGILGIGAISETGPVDRLEFVYEDGPHDVEAIYVANNGSTWLITKGRSNGIRAFELDASAWDSRDGRARERATLPLSPEMSTGHVITDASLSPDASRLAVRTYNSLYVFRVSPGSGAIESDEPIKTCDLRGLGEQQGEGIGWFPSGGRLILSSEGEAGQISMAECN